MWKEALQSAVPAELPSHNHPSLFSVAVTQLRKGLVDQNPGITAVLQSRIGSYGPAHRSRWTELSELDLPVGAGTNTARLSAALRGKGTVTLAGVKSREAGRP